MEEFAKKLEECNRKLVTIIDPHLRINFEKKEKDVDIIIKEKSNLFVEFKNAEVNDFNEDNYHISEKLLNESKITN